MEALVLRDFEPRPVVRQYQTGPTWRRRTPPSDATNSPRSTPSSETQAWRSADATGTPRHLRRSGPCLLDAREQVGASSASNRRRITSGRIFQFTIDNRCSRAYIDAEVCVDYCALQLAVPTARTAILFGHLPASRRQCAQIHGSTVDQSPRRRRARYGG